MTLLIRATVAKAAHDIVPAWPLESFIAVNPLAGEEGRPFENSAAIESRTRSASAYHSDYRSGRITDDDLIAAVIERIPEFSGSAERESLVTIGTVTLSPAQLLAAELPLLVSPEFEAPAPSPRLDRVDRLAAKWVAAYLDPDPLWPMPDREAGFYGAWRRLARHDSDLPLRARRRLRSVPDRADDALTAAIAGLGIPEPEVEQAMRAELAGLPGWTAQIKWRSEHVGDIDLSSYLAVRFTLRHALGDALPHDTRPGEMPLAESLATVWARAEVLVRQLGGTATIDRHSVGVIARLLALHPLDEHPFTWQRAYELHFRHQLLASLQNGAQSTDLPPMQLVMCIDPRSEGIRRQLERGPGIETLGFAGFFGVPIRYLGFGAREAVNSLPALLAPRHTVTEVAKDGRTAVRRTAGLRLRDSLASGLHAGDRVSAAPFALAETAGWFFGVATLVRTLVPGASGAIARRLDSITVPPLPSSVTVSAAFTLEERAQMAETAVRMMGLNRLAPLVVLAGHGSTSTNNLYQSALDCGACGGNPGAPNARAAAAIFNDPEVRSMLAIRGITIPTDSFFVAAEHDTVSDRVVILDRHLVPGSHLPALQQFEKLQSEAADRLVLERARDLPGVSARQSPARLRRRAHDWAEVYPELGLAGNAAMIIGPRELSRGVDLRRRVFLHSYRSELDPDGAALESILTAPVVVAQWINHQYYFSALNPDQLGAGTKTIHNAIGTLGVLSGQGGDLRRGLPWQSVGFGDELFHEPMRLAVIAQAPLDQIGEIVSRNQVLRALFDNDWITLTARADASMGWQRYTPYGWAALHHTSPTPEGAFQ